MKRFIIFFIIVALISACQDKINNPLTEYEAKDLFGNWSGSLSKPSVNVVLKLKEYNQYSISLMTFEENISKEIDIEKGIWLINSKKLFLYPNECAIDSTYKSFYLEGGKTMKSIIFESGDLLVDKNIGLYIRYIDYNNEVLSLLRK